MSLVFQPSNLSSPEHNSLKPISNSTLLTFEPLKEEKDELSNPPSSHINLLSTPNIGATFHNSVEISAHTIEEPLLNEDLQPMIKIENRKRSIKGNNEDGNVINLFQDD